MIGVSRSSTMTSSEYFPVCGAAGLSHFPCVKSGKFSGVFTLSPTEKITFEDLFRRIFSLIHCEAPAAEESAACALELTSFFLRLSLSRNGQDTPFCGVSAARYGEVVSCMTEAGPTRPTKRKSVKIPESANKNLTGAEHFGILIY